MSNTERQSFFLTAWMSLTVPASSALRAGRVCAPVLTAKENTIINEIMHRMAER